MARHTRKGRNPGPVDEWLDTLDYYRKNVAYDETCLFRAVSEQIFSCQLFHEKIRTACIEYGRQNYEEFSNLMPNKNDWNIYLDRLKKHMAVCGNLEIQLIIKTYKRGVLIFDGINRCVKEITNGSLLPEFLLLCHMGEDHYDVVYKKEFIQDAGFCQSIIYRALYEDVFQISNVPEIVDAMLYQKTPAMVNTLFSQEENTKEEDNTDMLLPIMKLKDLSIRKEPEENVNEYEYLLRTNIAPFPYKIAKALDPTIYRNIEYDTWTEMRKEMRLGEWYYGDNNLVKGSACIMKESSGEELRCYIQDIYKEENKCVIYITNLAEKRTVGLHELKPEEDAKPWPVPYRFSKNLVLSLPKVETILERRFRRKKEKKRTNSKGSLESEQAHDTSDNLIRMLEGAPLQVKDSNEPTNTNFKEETAVNNHTFKLEPEFDNSFLRNEASNDLYNPNENDWPQMPQFPLQNASTPNDSFNDLHYYPTDYPQYNVWTNPSTEYLTPVAQQNLSLPLTPQPFDYQQTPDVVNFLFNDVAYSPNVPQNYSQPQVEMYPQVYAQTPSPFTPILITSPEVPGYVLQSPMQPQPQQLSVYSPNIRMPYVQMSPFVYPPTPPPTWYMTGVNSQGFVFPVANNQNNN